MEFNFTAVQIAKILGGQVEGNTHVTVNTIEGIETQNGQAITFLSNKKYEKYLYTTKASVVIVEQQLVLQKKIKPTIIRVESPYIAYAMLMQAYEKKLIQQKEGIDDSVKIADNVEIGKGVYIGAFTFIEAGVKIGNNVQIYPHTYIGNEVSIGDNSIIYSGVKIYSKTEIGKDCVIHANAVLGTDGFGFAPLKTGAYIKIPHIGHVIIKDNVEIGANTCIDRGATAATIIGKGTKLDNLIQIAHNVKIGENTVIASQTGISGSSIIGNNCQLGGQVGVSGHLKIGNNSVLTGKTGIREDVPEGSKMFGIPATQARNYFKSVSIFNKLPTLSKQIRELQKKILSLEKFNKNN